MKHPNLPCNEIAFAVESRTRRPVRIIDKVCKVVRRLYDATYRGERLDADGRVFPIGTRLKCIAPRLIYIAPRSTSF